MVNPRKPGSPETPWCPLWSSLLRGTVTLLLLQEEPATDAQRHLTMSADLLLLSLLSAARPRVFSEPCISAIMHQHPPSGRGCPRSCLAWPACLGCPQSARSLVWMLSAGHSQLAKAMATSRVVMEAWKAMIFA